GLAVGPGRVVEFCRAAATLPAGDLYWAGRLTLVSRPEEIAIYDRVFRGVVEEEPRPAPVTVVEIEVALASPQELLRTKSFAELSTDELVELASLMQRLRLDIPTRRTRPREAARRGAPDPRPALRRAAEEVVDWNGGTRIGAALRALTRTNVVRGSVVVICSDGLDVGEPELLRREMARLSRLAHRVVWLNPLKEDPAYEPLARG